MATNKQIKANKTNAGKSTGPRSDTGKAVSSRNALTHGLTAERHFLDGDEQARFEELHSTLIKDHDPKTTLEIHQVKRIAGLVIRIERIPAFEVAVLSAIAEPRELTTKAAGTKGAQGKQGSAAASPERSFSPRLTIDQAIELAFDKNFFDKLTRYDGGLVKQLREAIRDLENLIYDRVDQAKSAAVIKKLEQPPAPPVQNATEAFQKFTI